MLSHRKDPAFFGHQQRTTQDTRSPLSPVKANATPPKPSEAAQRQSMKTAIQQSGPGFQATRGALDAEVERRSWTIPPVKWTTGLLDGIVDYRRKVQGRVMTAEASNQPPDDGDQLSKAKRALERAGIAVPSFDVERRLPRKPVGETMEVVKILALCPYKDQDMEGATDSGDGLRAALVSAGLCFSKEDPVNSTTTTALDHRVVWRNLREVCVRKAKDEGCLPVDGLERRILQEIDIIYNLCLRRGGWIVKVVMPMSGAPVDVTVSERGSSQPEPNMQYPLGCVVVEAAHPKVLMGNQQGRFSAADRQQLASLALRDVMRAAVLIQGGEDDIDRRILQLYEAASEHAVFRGKVWSVGELKRGRADHESSQERAVALARRNGKGTGVEAAELEIESLESQLESLPPGPDTLAKRRELLKKRKAAEEELTKRKKVKADKCSSAALACNESLCTCVSEATCTCRGHKHKSNASAGGTLYCPGDGHHRLVAEDVSVRSGGRQCGPQCIVHGATIYPLVGQPNSFKTNPPCRLPGHYSEKAVVGAVHPESVKKLKAEMERRKEAGERGAIQGGSFV